MTHYFTRTICFQDLNDFETDADFSADDEGNVSLEACQLGGMKLTATQIAEIMGRAQFDAQEASAQDWWVADGWAEAEQDYADGLGDYRYEMSREAAE